MKKKNYRIPIIISIIVCSVSGLLLILSLINDYHQAKSFQMLSDERGKIRVSNTIISNTTEEPTQEETEQKILPELELLYRQNTDLAGWLSLPAVQIDYPVMYDPPEVPEYYLHRAFDGSYSYPGVPFIGLRADTESDCLIIYGHNMNNGTMFGRLKQYGEKEFFQENPVFSFSSLYEEREYKIFAAVYCRILSEEESGFRYYDSVGMLTETEYNELVDWLMENAAHTSDVRPEYGQQIIILSTCHYHTDNGRFIVAGYSD